MRVVRLLLVTVLAGALAGAVASAATADHGQPMRAPTKADQARAKSLLLRRGDLAPGFTARRSTGSGHVACAAADESDLTTTGHAESPQYVLASPRKLFVVMSAAEVYKTVAQANTSWRRGSSPAGEQCVQRALERQLGAGSTLRSFERQPFPKVAPRTVAYRLVVDVASGGNVVRTYSDVIVLQRDRAQVLVFVLSGGAPLVRAEAVAFARLTAARLAASARTA
jgi:hypothetical protein